MAFKHYLLGFLAEQPMSGYSLHKHAFAPFRRPLSQIYRTLNKMMDEGLLDVERVVQEKLPNQNVYCITEAGRAELMSWLQQEEPVTLSHQEMLGRLWLGSKVEKQVVIKHLRSFEKHAQEQLDYFRRKMKPFVETRAEKEGYTIDNVYQQLTVEYGVRQFEVAVDWVGSALKLIESLESGEGRVAAGIEKASVGAARSSS